MAGRFVRRVVGVALVGVLALSGLILGATPASAGPDEPWVRSAEISSSDPAVPTISGRSYRAYRLRIEMTPIGSPSSDAYYAVSLDSGAPQELCTTAAPLDPSTPLAGECQNTQETVTPFTSFHYALNEYTNGVTPGATCLTVVVASMPGQTLPTAPFTLRFYTGFENPGGADARFAVNEMPAGAPCNPRLGAGADFDGDGADDLAVYRPGSQLWFVKGSNSEAAVVNWGSPGDVPTPGDYDRDGKTDIAVYRPSNQVWYVRQSSNGLTWTVNWGSAGDIPIPADYDGDSSTDFAVYRPSNQVWYIRQSSTQTMLAVNWGSAGDKPITGDYDGDGKADIAVFRPTGAVWFTRLSGGGSSVVNWGLADDVPMAGDYDGDGKTDIAVYGPTSGNWYARRSSNGSMLAINWGGTGYTPIALDADGDGSTDIGVFRRAGAVWLLRHSSTGSLSATNWGDPMDVAIGAPTGS